MNRARLIVSAAALAVALGGGSAVLQGGNSENARLANDVAPNLLLAQTPSPAAPAASSASSGSPVSMAEAVRIAERRTKGRASEVERERDKNAEVFEVKTISKDGPAKVIVLAASGRIDRVEERGIWDKLEDLFDDEDGREDAAMLNALETAKVTMAKAIEAAQANAGGEAVEAELREQYGKMLFEVLVLVDGIPRKLTIDHATGALVALPLRKNGDGDD